MKRKLLSLVLCTSMLLAAAACGGKGDSGGSSSVKPPVVDDVPVTVSTEHLDKDYVYLTYYQNDAPEQLEFQAPDYAMKVIGENGAINGLDVLSYEENYLVKQDFEGLSSANTVFYSDGVPATGVTEVQSADGSSSGRYWRLLEGGRNKQKIDITKLVYGDTRLVDTYGRMEIVAYKDSFQLAYELFSNKKLTDAVLSFDFTSERYTEFTSDGRIASLEDAEGNGLAFILPSDGTVSAEAISGGVKFTADAMDISIKTLIGFGVNVVPYTAGNAAKVEAVLAREQVTATVSQLMPVEKSQVTTKYDESVGTLLIDGNNPDANSYYNYTDGSDFNAYDRYDITLTNNSDVDVTMPVSLLKNTSALQGWQSVFGSSANFGMVGVVGIIRDAEGYPTGIPVQISKNWHTFPQDVEDVAESFTGQWYVGTTELEVPAGETVTYQFVNAYAHWGETNTASHAQLSLIGWNMYDLWEQLAVGNYGENICFYVNGLANSGWMQDIRPLHVTNHHGNGQKYNWSGNTGGAEFIRYDDGKYKERPVQNVISDFTSQGPNMTEIKYFGNTSDDKINVDIETNLLRTDDVTRLYFTLNYTFLEDVSFSRMTLFQFASDRYQSNYYQKFAYGNSEGVIKEGEHENFSGAFCFNDVAQQIDVPGEEQWFYLYDFDTSEREETNGVMYTVREYNAELNGATYTDPTFNYRKANERLSFELTTPAAVGRSIKKGSKISLVVELVCLPNSTATYYGISDYLNATKDLFNTSAQGLQQAQNGAIEVTAKTGELISSYPVTVATAKGSDVAAELSMKGGLGYVPLRFTGLDSYNGYKLQIKVNGVWTDVDQSVKGNDFWQVDKNDDGTYTLVYNVKNTVGTQFGTTNAYRLIKR